MRRGGVVLALVLFCLPVVALAQDQARIDRIEAAWRKWADWAGVSSGAISIGYKGQIVGGAGTGFAPQTPRPMASLSKALTAACLLKAAETGDIALYEPIGPQLGFDNMHPNAASLPVDAFISQTTGLTNDRTQRQMAAWLNSTKPRHHEVAAKTLRKGPKPGRFGGFVYNNENYAVLGALLDKVSGNDWLGYCNRLVFDAMDTPLVASPQYGAFGAWGGVQMSTEHYLRFVMAHFGTGLMAREPGAFPHTLLQDGAFYGAGTFYRPFRSKHNFWHFGAQCFGKGAEAGSYFAHWKGEWAVTVTYDICATDAQMISLDQALVGAVFTL
jgi:CubicO group peptidase (beta-lactamase class C family)